MLVPARTVSMVRFAGRCTMFSGISTWFPARKNKALSRLLDHQLCRSCLKAILYFVGFCGDASLPEALQSSPDDRPEAPCSCLGTLSFRIRGRRIARHVLPKYHRNHLGAHSRHVKCLGLPIHAHLIYICWNRLVVYSPQVCKPPSSSFLTIILLELPLQLFCGSRRHEITPIFAHL